MGEEKRLPKNFICHFHRLRSLIYDSWIISFSIFLKFYYKKHFQYVQTHLNLQTISSIFLRKVVTTKKNISISLLSWLRSWNAVSSQISSSRKVHRLLFPFFCMLLIWIFEDIEKETRNLMKKKKSTMPSCLQTVDWKCCTYETHIMRIRSLTRFCGRRIIFVILTYCSFPHVMKLFHVFTKNYL